MSVELRPLTRRQQRELRGYVSWAPLLFRAILFVSVVAVLAWLLRSIHGRLTSAVSIFAHDAWWATPVVIFAVALYLASGRWTGGRSFRAKVRADLAGGVAAARRVSVVDAIEVAEHEDEGPTYFLHTEDGKTMFFAGQYMDRLRRKGFPWRRFTILEAPASGVFFELSAEGERVTPSVRRGPLPWHEVKKYGILRKKYDVLDVDFESLKQVPPTPE